MGQNAYRQKAIVHLQTQTFKLFHRHQRRTKKDERLRFATQSCLDAATKKRTFSPCDKPW